MGAGDKEGSHVISRWGGIGGGKSQRRLGGGGGESRGERGGGGVIGWRVNES